MRVNERVHFVHYVCELSISIFLKPGIFAYNKPAFSLNSVPALSEHVFFLLLTFFLQGRIVRVYGFVAFRQHIDDGLLQFCLYLFKRVFSNEVVNIKLEPFFFRIGLWDFDFKEMSDPFSERMELFSPKPKRLILTSFMKSST